MGRARDIETGIARESGYISKFFRLLSPSDSARPRAITQRFIVNLRGFLARERPPENLFRRNYLRKHEDLCDLLPCTVVNFMYGREQLVGGCKF